jgi:hypothetical protein
MHLLVFTHILTKCTVQEAKSWTYFATDTFWKHATCHYVYPFSQAALVFAFFSDVKVLSAVGVTVTSHSVELLCILQHVTNLLLSHYVNSIFVTTQLISCPL